MPLTAPIEPGAVSPVDGASLLGRGLTDGPGAARSIAGAELAELVGGVRLARQIVVVGVTFDYTPTAGTLFVIVEGQGAGGGGAASDEPNGAGASSGGGSGGYIRAFFTVAELGTLPVAITNGAGGAAGQPSPGTIPGGDGGESTFGDLITLTGGGGGAIAATGVVDGGAGGAIPVAPLNTLQNLGQRGGAGVLYTSGEGGLELAIGGDGAPSILGLPGRGGKSVSSLAVIDGFAASFGAGGGAGAALSGGTAMGGQGGQAVWVISEFGG